MKLQDGLDPKIYHQGIDTLRTAHIIENSDAYLKYKDIISSLDNVKDEAIILNKSYDYEGGLAFDFYTFGKFFMLPKGMGRYKYVIVSDDITISFSTVKFGAGNYTIPQIVVDYRSKFLSLLGYEEAYNTVLSMFETLLECDISNLFRTQLMRIDLCTDIGNIEYVPLDKYRFQTTFKSQSHLPFIEHARYNRLTGFTFGKGDYMFRIYDKRLELNNNSSKLWLTRLWVHNGYPNDGSKPPVWRHEIQFRRPYLKKFRPPNCKDEVRFFFNILPKLWSYGFNKVRYVDISNDNILKIMNMELGNEALKKVFSRTREASPSTVWSLVSTWGGFTSISPSLVRDFKQSDFTVAKRFLKAFISSSYKASNGDPFSPFLILQKVQENLNDNFGTNLHDYGENKVLSSLLDNSSYIQDYGFTIDYENRFLSLKAYSDLSESFRNLDDPLFNNNEHRLAGLLGTSIDGLRDNLDYFLETNYEYECTEIQPIYEVEYCEY